MTGGSQLLQELVYDTIDRFIPGIVSLVVWSICAGSNLGSIADWLFRGSIALKQSAFIQSATLLSFAYVTGHLISPVGSFFHSRILAVVFVREFDLLRQIIAEPDGPHPRSIGMFYRAELLREYGNDLAKLSASQGRQHVYRCYDLIRLMDPTIGSRLAKMRAQYRMLEGIYVAFGAAILITLFSYFVGSKGPEQTVVLLFGTLVLLLISLWATVRFFLTYQWAVINEYFLLKEKAGAPS